LLAVVFMTNGDDCSTTDDSIYLDTPEASAQWGSDPRLRCTRAASTMQSMERYLRGLEFARGAYTGYGPQPATLGAIVGIPEGSADSIDLSDEHMQVVETGDITNPLRDSCVSADGATHADPPRRFLEFRQELHQPMSFASICSDDFMPAFESLLEYSRWGDGRTGCLARALPRDARGLVNCTVTETLPSAREENRVTHCADVPGRTFLRRVTLWGAEREQCRVTQLSETTPGAAGWVYEDDLSEPVVATWCARTPQLIRFTPRGRPPTGAIVRLECTYALRSEVSGSRCLDERTAPRCARGMICDAAHDACNTRRARDAPPLQCDRIENLCAVRCASDADCEAASLEGHVCDLRPYEEAATGAAYEALTPEQRAEVRGVCVNPSCEM
jgi:hypothetical protein